MVYADDDGRESWGHLVGTLLDELHRLARRIRPHIPFPEVNTAYHFVDRNAGSILDVGCGTGEPMKFINRSHSFRAVGVDIFQPSLRECRRLGIYENLLRCDLLYLPFKEKSIDVVVCLTVIEHLERHDGEKLLQEMEAIARQRVIVSTPVGSYKLGGCGDNPHQEHKYIWSPAEFRRRGYRVRGIGIRGMLGEGALRSRLPRFLHPLTWALWVLAGPVVYFMPKLGGTQVCHRQNTDPV